MTNLYIQASTAHFEAKKLEAEAVLDTYLSDAVGIGEHSDITEAVIAELDKMSAAHDRIEMIEKYFSKND